jgi:hypothetical protein
VDASVSALYTFTSYATEKGYLIEVWQRGIRTMTQPKEALYGVRKDEGTMHGERGTDEIGHSAVHDSIERARWLWVKSMLDQPRDREWRIREQSCWGKGGSAQRPETHL